MSRINLSISLLSRNKLPVLFILLTVLTFYGCGYSLKGQGTFLPEHIKALYIPELQNKTTKFEIEKNISEVLIEEFLSRGNFTLVDSEKDADATLTGAIVEYRTSPKSIDENGLATSYSIAISVSVEFKDMKTNKVLFQDNRYTVTEDYQMTEVGSDFLEQEQYAIEAAAKTLSEALVAAILEGF